jgi:hypothetical protein
VTLVLELARATGAPDVTLVAVNGAERFWAAQGFDADEDAEAGGYGPGTLVMRRPLA